MQKEYYMRTLAGDGDKWKLNTELDARFERACAVLEERDREILVLTISLQAVRAELLEERMKRTALETGQDMPLRKSYGPINIS